LYVRSSSERLSALSRLPSLFGLPGSTF
jgi:hypothetical protein